MGDSDKLPNSGPGSYRFVELRRYLDALLEGLNVRERVTLIIHDWGSTLGFDWANRHRDAVKGIAYMEAMVGRQYWDHWDKFWVIDILSSEHVRIAAGRGQMKVCEISLANNAGNVLNPRPLVTAPAAAGAADEQGAMGRV
jgi:pimeloyl-ACP methyl ester carboxylesterase